MRSFVLLVMMAASGVVAGAQQVPNIKMGLWEKTLSATGPGGRAISSTTKSCINQAEYKKMIDNVQKPRPECTTKLTQVSNGYTFTSNCTVNGTVMAITGSTTFPDATHIVSDSHSVTTRNGTKSENNMHSTSRWLSADCGNIKPGDSQ
jgi:hypothetical protein